jgi:hypothetical protein
MVFVVTPKQTITNFLTQADKLLPFIISWNDEVSRFLQRDPVINISEPVLAVTY